MGFLIVLLIYLHKIRPGHNLKSTTYIDSMNEIDNDVQVLDRVIVGDVSFTFQDMFTWNNLRIISHVFTEYERERVRETALHFM